MNRMSIGSLFFGAVWWASPSVIDDDVLDAGLLEVLAGDGDPAGVDVVGVELAAGLAEGHREPEPRLAGRGAQLDDPLGADRLGELAEQAAVGRRDVGVPLAAAGVLERGEDPLLAVVLGQRRLARAAAPLPSAPGRGRDRSRPGPPRPPGPRGSSSAVSLPSLLASRSRSFAAAASISAAESVPSWSVSNNWSSGFCGPPRPGCPGCGPGGCAEPSWARTVAPIIMAIAMAIRFIVDPPD